MPAWIAATSSAVSGAHIDAGDLAGEARADLADGDGHGAVPEAVSEVYEAIAQLYGESRCIAVPRRSRVPSVAPGVGTQNEINPVNERRGGGSSSTLSAEA